MKQQKKSDVLCLFLIIWRKKSDVNQDYPGFKNTVFKQTAALQTGDMKSERRGWFIKQTEGVLENEFYEKCGILHFQSLTQTRLFFLWDFIVLINLCFCLTKSRKAQATAWNKSAKTTLS